MYILRGSTPFHLKFESKIANCKKKILTERASSGKGEMCALTARKESILEVWTFMADHIAHEKTESLERFSRRRSSSESSMSTY